MIEKIMEIFKREKVDKDYDIGEIERKARIIASSYSDLLGKYDEQTEELLELLREKCNGLWACRQYYEGAMQLKEEIKSLKSDKAEKMQEISALKRRFGEVAESIISTDLVKKPQSLANINELATYLQLLRFVDKDMIPVKKILTAMKKMKVTKEDIERDYSEIYIALKMKDW